MTERPQYDELAKRILEHISSAGADADLVAATWYGYLAALLEWGLIEPEDHSRLYRLVPPLDPNPVVQIFLGV